MDVPQAPKRSDLLADRAAATPDRVGLIRTVDGTQWTYGELDNEVAQTAGRLAALGIDDGDRIGLLLENRVSFLRVLYAAFRLGATAVPFNLALDEPTRATQIQRADPAVLVCSDATTAHALDHADSRDAVAVDPATAPTQLSAIEPVAYEPAATTADTDRLLLYTSGTTGEPKGVRLTASNLRASAVASAFRLGVTPTDRWLAPLPAYHMGGLAPHLRSTIYGTTAILQPEFDADNTLDALNRFNATCISLVPTAVSRLLDAGSLPDLRFVLCGGAPTPESLVERCADRNVPLCPTYGMTETASQVATALPEQARTHNGTVGQPLQWTDITVINDDGERVERGTRGELVVDGPTVTPGYDDPEVTDNAVCENGLRTGDVGYRDEAGRLWVTGRVDEMIVTGGENVHPERVRKAILDAGAATAAPEIDEVTVVGLDDPEWGERVGALIIPAEASAEPAIVQSFRQGELRAQLTSKLARYELPKTVGTAASVPRTASGTVDRTAVRTALQRSGQRVDDG